MFAKLYPKFALVSAGEAAVYLIDGGVEICAQCAKLGDKISSQKTCDVITSVVLQFLGFDGRVC